MNSGSSLDGSAAHVSTGHLPPPETVAALVREAHARFGSNRDGQVSTVYPSLANRPPDLFGLAIVGTNGALHVQGDWEALFPIMSVSKPFVFALICDVLGSTATRDRLGVNATGLPFNSVEAIERSADGRTNPMVNSGAIAAASLAPGATREDKWAFLVDGLSRFAGRPLTLNREVHACASETNLRNQALARLLDSYGLLGTGPDDALDLYTRQCSLDVTARDLAVMGACLADGGVNPLTRQPVIGEESGRRALAVMTTAGLYQTSGEWLYDVGLPGKSGIGGGLVAVSPGKGGMGAFAPRLDAAGNSVKGQRAAGFLSDRLGLSIFASKVDP